jgi:hypothetical protein
MNPVHLQKFLGGVEYPADKRRLVERARANGADAEVFAVLERLPEKEFRTPADVSQAVGSIASRGARVPPR